MTSAAMLCLGSISRAYASCTNNLDEEGKACGTWNCGENGDNVTCSLSKGVFTVSGSGKMADYNYYWNDKLNTDAYDSPWADYLQEVTSVNVGDGVTSIGKGAFGYNAGNLTTISGMKDVASIGEDAFLEATSLTSVDMPNVTSIGSGAFWGATALTSVDMPNVTSIGNYAFVYATNLKYVGFDPNKLTDDNIGENAFAYYDNGLFKPLAVMLSCDGSSGYNICTTCTSGQVYQLGTGCSDSCSEGYAASNGLCKKNPTQSTPATPVDDDLIDDIDDLESCPEGKIAKGDSCIPASQGCGANYKLSDGICYRIRYTPAEAAQVAGESNTIFLYYK